MIRIKRGGAVMRMAATFAAISCLLVGLWTITAAAPSGAASSNNSSVTFALEPGYHPFDIFPLTNAGELDGVNTYFFAYLMYPTLYGYGMGQTFGMDPQRSLALPPVYSDAGGTATVTVTLKPWKWSDGTPVTARDVQFWYDLVKADPSSWGGYVPGGFPDNVTTFKILSPTKFELVLNRSYNQTWFTNNELSQLIPIPQAQWDRTSATSPVGNYDLNADGSVNVAGAQAVASFLEAQGTDDATFQTNPLWKVVDGPYRLESFSASGPVTLVANPSYSGHKARIKTFTEQSYTSDTAEVDAVESGSVDYGFLPPNAAKLIGSLSSRGYTVQQWYTELLAYLTLNQNNPSLGPVFKQAYIRQALEMLINQKAIISAIYGGYGVQGCGPVPLQPDKALVTPYERSCPFRYNPAKARALLAAHGWKIVKGGVSSCIRPGSGSNECGAGIASGTNLEFTLLYPSGLSELTATLEDLQSSFESVGVKLNPKSGTITTVYSTVVSCQTSQPSCSWQAGLSGFVYCPDCYPTGGELFSSGGVANPSNYSNAEADQLIAQTHDSASSSSFTTYENYITNQVPVLWLPESPYQISVVKKTLRGWSPQNLDQNIVPENWYWSS